MSAFCDLRNVGARLQLPAHVSGPMPEVGKAGKGRRVTAIEPALLIEECVLDRAKVIPVIEYQEWLAITVAQE